MVAGALTVDKYVRNVTNPVVGTTVQPYDGENYYQARIVDAGERHPSRRSFEVPCTDLDTLLQGSPLHDP